MRRYGYTFKRAYKVLKINHWDYNLTRQYINYKIMVYWVSKICIEYSIVGICQLYRKYGSWSKQVKIAISMNNSCSMFK